MSLSRRERTALRGIAAGICCSDPGLASMMACFSRVAADEDMPGHERAPVAIKRVLALLLAVAIAVVRLVARATGACLCTYGQAGLWTMMPYGRPPLSRPSPGDQGPSSGRTLS
jgi:hypothetical protein